MPRPSHGLPPISIPRRQYKLNQRYIKNVALLARLLLTSVWPSTTLWYETVSIESTRRSLEYGFHIDRCSQYV